MNEVVNLRELHGFGVLAISVRGPAPLGNLLASSVTGQSCPFAVTFWARCERYGKGLAQEDQLTLVDIIVDSPCCR